MLGGWPRACQIDQVIVHPVDASLERPLRVYRALQHQVLRLTLAKGVHPEHSSPHRGPRRPSHARRSSAGNRVLVHVIVVAAVDLALQAGTAGDWPLNVFDDAQAAAQLPTLRSMASADLHNLVFQRDYRIIPAIMNGWKP